jgi:hypothetical protein
MEPGLLVKPQKIKLHELGAVGLQNILYHFY